MTSAAKAAGGRTGAATLVGLAAPGAAGLLLLFMGPALIVIGLAFTDWQFGARSLHLVGLANFVGLAADPVFLKALANTALYALIVTPTTVVLGLAVALLIQGGTSLRSFYRTLHFLPYMATLAAMSIAWEALLHPTIGLLNHTLAAVGVSGANWLRDPATVLPTLAAIGVWQNFGYAMVLFLAGLNAIPADLYEAAALDGADDLASRLRLVTLPQLAPISLLIAVVTLLRALSVFSNVAILTQGGPGHGSEVLLYRLYVESFDYFRAGYGAAIACAFLVIVGLLTALQVKLGERRAAAA